MQGHSIEQESRLQEIKEDRRKGDELARYPLERRIQAPTPRQGQARAGEKDDGEYASTSGSVRPATQDAQIGGIAYRDLLQKSSKN